MAKLIEITGKALAGEWGTNDETGAGIPVLRTTNFTNEGVVDYSDVVTRTITKKNIDEKYLRAGDIIIEKSGGSDKYPVGRVIYFDGPSNTYLFNNFTGLLRVKDQEKWFPKYVFFSLYGNYRRGGTRPYENKTTGLHNLKTDDYVSQYEVVEADYSRQKEICTHLDKLYSIIKMREEELVKLDELIKARFVEMFWNPANNEKGFIKAPMGDYMTVLTDFSSNGSYKTLDSGVTMYDEPNYAWMVRTTDLESGDMTAIKYIDEEAYELLAKSKIYGGEIIMNKIGSAGKIYLMPQIDMPASLGRNAFMFRYDDRINVKFLYHLLTSEYGQREIQQYVRGAVTKTITKNDVRAVLIIVPPIELQNEFESFVAEVDKSKVVVQKALDEAQILFDSLMQEYFG
jgi:Restriction endonuclease S subunits